MKVHSLFKAASIAFVITNLFGQGELRKFEEFLAIGNEPNFTSIGSKIEAYRFIWLRTFEHPVSIRVWRQGSRANVVVVLLAGSSGFDLGKVLERRSFSITEKAWASLKHELEEVRLFDGFVKPGEAKSPTKIEVSSDGSHLRFEYLFQGKAGVVDISQPNPADSITDARALNLARALVTLGLTRSPLFY